MTHLLDLGSRKFWQLTGRPVDLEGRERWLDAPVSRVPLHETFHVYVDAHGVLRTDHELRVRSAPAVRLHYKCERVS